MSHSTTEDQAPDNPRSARRREQILDAAARCFTKLGFAKATIAEIAVQAGLSKPVIYNHFSNKDEIIASLEEELVVRWTKAARLEEPSRKLTHCQAIAQSFQASLNFFAANPILREFLVSHPHMFVLGRGSAMDRAILKVRTRLSDFIAEGQQAGDIRPEIDPAITAELLRLVHVTVIGQNFALDAGPQAPVVSLGELSIDVVIRGIAARPASLGKR